MEEEHTHAGARFVQGLLLITEIAVISDEPFFQYSTACEEFVFGPRAGYGRDVSSCHCAGFDVRTDTGIYARLALQELMKVRLNKCLGFGMAAPPELLRTNSRDSSRISAEERASFFQRALRSGRLLLLR